MKTFFLSLFIFTGVALQAQSVKINPNDLKNPESFGHTILAVAKKGSAKQWKELLSKELSEKGDEFVNNHFDVWKKAFTPLLKQYKNVEEVTVKLENATLLKIDKYSVIIIKENGRYYINER